MPLPLLAVPLVLKAKAGVLAGKAGLKLVTAKGAKAAGTKVARTAIGKKVVAKSVRRQATLRGMTPGARAIAATAAKKAVTWGIPATAIAVGAGSLGIPAYTGAVKTAAEAEKTRVEALRDVARLVERGRLTPDEAARLTEATGLDKPVAPPAPPIPFLDPKVLLPLAIILGVIFILPRLIPPRR